jgi:virginiamycin A acetyltransferase
MNHFIENSNISNQGVQLYRDVRILGSEIERNCVVGDFSRITNSSLKGYNRIDRNSLVYHSEIGQFSYLGSGSVVMHSKVGKFCSLSWGITIGPANHDYEYLTTHDFLYNNYYNLKPDVEPAVYNRFEKKTEIGNDVWIGTNVTVLNGVKIGDGAVIGANSIVTKDVPAYAIVIGNPGKVVRYRFDEKLIAELIQLKWWDLPEEKIRANFDLFKSKDIATIIETLKNIK